MENGGQNCCAGSRNYVHADIYDKYVSKAKELAESRVTGDPWQESTNTGSLVGT